MAVSRFRAGSLRGTGPAVHRWGGLGLPATVGIILLTGFVGASLARRQGAGAVRRIQAAMDQGRMPADELLDGVLIFAAGLLLITPGFLTDAVGFSLLAPPVRDFVRVLVAHAIRRSIRERVVIHTTIRTDSDGMFTGSSRGSGEAIDVEAEVLDSEDS
jgi:UPF0716 protein FxsA